MATTSQTESFFQEYTSQDAIERYTKATAGVGINYLLDHDYKKIYLEAIRSLPAGIRGKGLNILEFGCGGGMNLIHLVAVLQHEGIQVNKAVGTDFSPVLIEAARREAKQYLPKEDQGRVDFFVGKNETLAEDLGKALGKSKSEMADRFDLIFGVNTMRYCHRAKTELDCAKDILTLLVPGGVCVNIDMNDRFLFFKSSLRNGIKTQQQRGHESFLPSLDEYAAPFSNAGFELQRRAYFCWIPHSAGSAMCIILAMASPVLNLVANSRAMRSLVVAQKPGGGKK